MTPIKFRIPYRDEFYYWGFITDEDGLDFIEPQHCGLPFHSVATADTLPWLMQNSERLLGYDRNENEVYENDTAFWHVSVTVNDGFGTGDLKLHIKTGNIHNIPEELK